MKKNVFKCIYKNKFQVVTILFESTICPAALHSSIELHLSMSVWPSPCPLVVKEEHQVEPLIGLLLPLLPQTEDIFGWDRDGHPVVQQALFGHFWVDDLERAISQSKGYSSLFLALAQLFYGLADILTMRFFSPDSVNIVQITYLSASSPVDRSH